MKFDRLIKEHSKLPYNNPTKATPSQEHSKLPHNNSIKIPTLGAKVTPSQELSKLPYINSKVKLTQEQIQTLDYWISENLTNGITSDLYERNLTTPDMRDVEENDPGYDEAWLNRNNELITQAIDYILDSLKILREDHVKASLKGLYNM